MKRPSAGYTILEAMIFLVVSAGLFVLIYPNYASRQRNIQFTQSVRELDSKIQDAINDVATGYFPDTSTVNCTVADQQPATQLQLSLSAGSQQGTRRACVFLGKALNFDGNGNLNIFTVVGKRQVNSENVENLNEAKPKAVHPTPADNTIPSLTENYALRWGLKTKKIVILNTPGPIPLNTFVVTTKLNGNNRQSDIIPIGGVNNMNESKELVANDINSFYLVSNSSGNGWDDSNKNRSGGLLLCLSDAGNDKQAAILVGGRAGIAKTEVVLEKDNINNSFGNGICG